jgi:hypothetical protein
VERTLAEVDPTATTAEPYLDAVRRCLPLRDAVIEALTGTWQAAGELHAKLTSDPAAIWRFRAIIDAALDELHLDESNFAWRAAEDRIADETPGTDLDTVSTWLGRVGLAAGFVGAEPVAAAASVADLLVQGILLVQRILTTMEQQLGVDAFLKPSDALAIDQSWSGVGVDVFFLALNLWQSRGDIKTLRGLR